nr:high mobility group B protein 3 [Zostera marina]
MGKAKASVKSCRKTNNSLVARKKPLKKDKDPNKPKRPPSAFFVFMEEFRVTFKEKNPKNKSVAVVGKAGGEKWKSFSESEKAPFIAKAEKRKVEYNKAMTLYNKKLAGETVDEEEEGVGSDKSKSEVDVESREEEDDDDDDDDDE